MNPSTNSRLAKQTKKEQALCTYSFWYEVPIYGIDTTFWRLALDYHPGYLTARVFTNKQFTRAVKIDLQKLINLLENDTQLLGYDCSGELDESQKQV